ncbi:OFA family MFS transporter [soil metagenome]
MPIIPVGGARYPIAWDAMTATRPATSHGTRLLGGGALVNLALGSLFAWSLFVEPLADEFGNSAAAISSVFSVSVVIFAAIVLAGGSIADRHPPRRIVVASAVIAMLGLLLAARAPSLLWVIAGYGVLFGIANGLGYATAVAVAGKGFGDRRGFALGVVVGAYAAGPLVASPAISFLLARVGWRGALVALAAGIGVLLLVGAFLLGAGIGGGGDSDADGDAAADGRPILLQPSGAVLWLAFMLGTLPAMLVVAHAASIASTGGLNAAAVSAAVAILAAGNLAGRAGGGWLSDRLGRLPGLRAATAGLALSLVTVSMLTATVPMLVLMALVGIGYGTQSSLVPALTADLFGTANFGANYGRVFTGWGVAGVAGPQLGAQLSARTGDFDLALWLAAVCALAAFVLHLLLGRIDGVAND